VYGGGVYIGSNTGVFYALNESTGTVAWSRLLGYVPDLTCKARGITATATVAADPGTSAPTVYVASGDGYLFALDALTGGERWQSPVMPTSATENDYYQWSSPTVANGRIYIGFSSQCDTPLVRGGVKMFDQATGQELAVWYSVPDGVIGGGVWSSVAATATSVFATTGNADTSGTYDQDSIVRLDATTLTRKAHWTVPNAELILDPDFGASPTLFTAGGVNMVGACNKNGWFYAWRTGDLQQRWKFKVTNGTPYGEKTCLGAAAWDGSGLFVAASGTTIGGVATKGSVRRLDPASGTPIWETPIDGGITGSPALNGGGVLSVPIYDTSGGTNGVYLLDSETGAILRYFKRGRVFSQATFAGRYLFIATEGNSLTALRVP
jgi:polyvinyl alcohol dehydrogenase (cytochrome)